MDHKPRRLDGVYKFVSDPVVFERAKRFSFWSFVLVGLFALMTSATLPSLTKGEDVVKRAEELSEPAQTKIAEKSLYNLSALSSKSNEIVVPKNYLTTTDEKLEVVITDDSGKEVQDFQVTQKKETDGDHLTLAETSNLKKAGKFHLLARDSVTKVTVFEQDYLWGVLAFNPDQAIYQTNQKAELAMAVLNERGKMVCDAKLDLTITDPSGKTSLLSTTDQTITLNEKECQPICCRFL